MDSGDWQKIKSLFNAVLDLPESERAAKLAGADLRLRQEVENLIHSHESLGEFISEPAIIDAGFSAEIGIDSQIGKQIDSYKVLEEIGHGGMGTVYLAVRNDDFEKRVALKLIKRGMDTNSVLKRFMLERQILARLDHPFIAKLLDGGSTDGLPYLVMEFIEGEKITDFSDSHEFSIAERLELFQKVASAVSFAHQNLIVHRDIKPSNILVTDDGTPKLLDFGIAKLLHPDWAAETNDATATMFRVMTPEYASPEQIRGLAITTTSDVYSLGVVLYELLTGTRPFKFETHQPEEIAQKILIAEPIRPSSVVSGSTAADKPTLKKSIHRTDPKSKTDDLKSLRGDLDNIILKALRKEPERRYQSVQEFSEDIRRHLAGLPVTATNDTRMYRLRKFVKRHRGGVFAGTLVGLILLISTGITSWQAIVAKREQSKAEKRFNQVRKLANTVLFEYHDGIAKFAGSMPLREKMVKDALEYLDNLSAENIADKDLQLELAAAYEKVGDLQGNPFQSNLGDQAGALVSYRKSLAIREMVFASNPTDAATEFSIGNSYNNIGNILWAKNENEDAILSYQHGLTIHESLSKSGSTVDYNRGRIIALNGIAHAQSQKGDMTGALETYRTMLAVSESILATNPADANYRRNVAVGYLKLADSLSQTGDYKNASGGYARSIQIFSDLAAADKDDADALRDLSLAYGNAADSYTDVKDYIIAIEFNEKALAIQRQLASVDTGNIRIQFDIAQTLRDIGHDFLFLKQYQKAAETFQEAIKKFKESTAKNPDYAQPRKSFGYSYLNYAQVLLRTGNEAAALENFQNALAVFETESIRKQVPDALADAYEGIAEIRQNAGRIEEAKDLFNKSLSIWKELERSGELTDPDSIERLGKQIAKCDAISVKSQK